MRWISLGLVTLALAACSSEADVGRIESEIESWMRDQGTVRVTVDCPSAIEWRTGNDFHCIAEDRHGTTVRVTVTMENDAGDVTWVVD